LNCAGYQCSDAKEHVTSFHESKRQRYINNGLKFDFQFLLMTYLHQLSVQPPAMQEPQNTTDSQLDSNGLDQQAINRYMDLASRRVLAPYRWTGSQAGLFAIAETGNQVSRQGIAIYLVKDGKTISYQLTPDERREFHDLMELDLNRSRSFTVEA
jgi:hypothetical protein